MSFNFPQRNLLKPAVNIVQWWIILDDVCSKLRTEYRSHRRENIKFLRKLLGKLKVCISQFNSHSVFSFMAVPLTFPKSYHIQCWWKALACSNNSVSIGSKDGNYRYSFSVEKISRVVCSAKHIGTSSSM